VCSGVWLPNHFWISKVCDTKGQYTGTSLERTTVCGVDSCYVHLCSKHQQGQGLH
jgi:hypothetical protein